MRYLNKIFSLLKSNNIKTKYSHNNIVAKENGVRKMEVDCSGLVEFWLSRCHKSALSELYAFVHKVRNTNKYKITRLYSVDFYDFFAHLLMNKSSEWERIDFKDSLVEGDIISFTNPQKQSRCAHVAIIQKEIFRSDTSIKLQIIDSSAISHFNDWRQGTNMGVGQGVIELKINQGIIDNVLYNNECEKHRLVEIGRLRKLITKK